MVKIRKQQVDETLMNLDNLDPQVCKELLGEITEDGNCLVKVRKIDSDPTHAELELIKYQPSPRKKD